MIVKLPYPPPECRYWSHTSRGRRIVSDEGRLYIALAETIIGGNAGIKLASVGIAVFRPSWSQDREDRGELLVMLDVLRRLWMSLECRIVYEMARVDYDDPRVEITLSQE